MKPSSSTETETQDELFEKLFKPAVKNLASQATIDRFAAALKNEKTRFSWLFKTDPGSNIFES